MAPSSSSAFGNSGFATSARSRHIFRFSMVWNLANASAIFFPVAFVRRQIHLQMQFAQFRRRGRADRRDAHAADVAHVLEPPEKDVEKRRHAVRAREHQPVVGIQFQQRIHDGVGLRRWRDFDGRHFQHVRAQFGELLRKIPGLPARAGDDDAPAEQRTVLKPVQFSAQFHHVADDGQRRRRQFFFRGQTGNGGQRAGDGFLPSRSCPSESWPRAFPAACRAR